MKPTTEEIKQLRTARELNLPEIINDVPVVEKEMVNRCVRLNAINGELEEAKCLALKNGRSATLLKLAAKGSKDFYSRMDNLRKKHPTAQIPPISTINRHRLAFIHGLVLAGKIPSSHTSTLWRYIKEIKASGDLEITEMVKKYGTINNILRAKPGMGAAATQTELEVREDRALAAQIGRLKSSLSRRKRVIDTKLCTVIFQCFDSASKAGKQEQSSAEGDVVPSQEASAIKSI